MATVIIDGARVARAREKHGLTVEHCSYLMFERFGYHTTTTRWKVLESVIAPRTTSYAAAIAAVVQVNGADCLAPGKGKKHVE